MILLKNCHYIATFDENDAEFSGYDLLIDGNKVSEIAKDIEASADCETIDCSNLVVIPGMVNTHHHFYQTLTRNLPGAQDAKLFDWLVYLYPIWARIDAEAVYYSSLLAMAELMLTGATCSTDHHYLYPEGFDGDLMGLQFDAAEKLGMRFAPTRGSMTRGKSSGGLPPDNVVQSVDKVLKDSERVIDRYHDDSDFSMKKIILAPCSPFSVEENVMRETAKLARDKGVYLHTHLAETADEDEYCMTNHCKRPLALMHDWGWTGEDVFFAHGIFFNDMELDILAKTGTGIAHCPSSNMRLGSGIARIMEMKERSIRVGIAVDGSASNDTSDMIGEVRQALLLQRVKYGSSALSARDVLQMATAGGADLLGFKKIGMIKPGYAADIAAFDISKIGHAGSLSDPLASLIFTGFDHRVSLNIVNGKIAVRDGKLVNIDEDWLVAEVNEVAGRVCSG
ncbi:MAG: 8-oxoguanine deaminase [Candidatus Zixiibacteriota bacterium]